MEQRQQAFLQRGVEVNQEIATGEQIEPGERRIHDHIVLGEQHHVADTRVDKVAVALSAEEARQALRRDIRGYRGGVASSPGERDRIRIEIRRKDLQRGCGRSGQPLPGLRESHREREGLLAGGAPGNPGAKPPVGSGASEQLREHDGFEFLPGLRIPEETRHADQHFLEEQIEFRGVCEQEG